MGKEQSVPIFRVPHTFQNLLTKNYPPSGVLTKPDRIPTGEEGNWLPFIRNEKEPLQNNWFCVKQPSSNDLKSNITWKQARDRETEFFAITAPWCELDEGYQKYLRTVNLIERSSLVLSDLISKRYISFSTTSIMEKIMLMRMPQAS